MNRAMMALENCTTIEDAKEIAKSMRETSIAVSKRYGEEHHISKEFSERYWNFVDEMVFKFRKK